MKGLRSLKFLVQASLQPALEKISDELPGHVQIEPGCQMRHVR
jgi:hypothetical protein